MTKIVLVTPRLILRELEAGDLDFVASMLADEEVMRFYPQIYQRTDAEAWLNRQRMRYQRDGHALWLVVDRRSNEPLGQVGLITQLIEGVPTREIGYLVNRPHWRRGIATEAAQAVRDHAFAAQDLPCVVAQIRPMNWPSRGVAAKLGMREVKLNLHGGLEHILHRFDRDQVNACGSG